MNQIQITNPDKIVYPKQKIKKIDVIEYYLAVSKLMLPYVKNRLLSAIRCHDGIGGECFFKKHPSSDKNVEIFNHGGEDYFYIKNSTQLAFQAQMGTLEFHTWCSSVNRFSHPDIMVFDLDPDENLCVDRLRDAVKKVKAVLDELGLKSFLKTSGGKGYHIVLPFKKTKDWDSFYAFSKNVASLIESKWQSEFTTNVRKSERKDKIFIDYLRNNLGSTCVAPYSLRARESAPISMPIDWTNLDKITPDEVNIKNYQNYLGDSWKDFFSISQQLK